MRLTTTTNLNTYEFSKDHLTNLLEELQEKLVLNIDRPCLWESREEGLVSKFVEEYSFTPFAAVYTHLKEIGGSVDLTLFLNYFLEDEELKQGFTDALYQKHPSLQVRETLFNIIYQSFFEYRLLRAYRSFLYEDLYKLYFIKHSKDLKIVSHTYLDYFRGYDFAIKKKGYVFYVHIAQNSFTSKQALENKELLGKNRDFEHHFNLFYDTDTLDVYTFCKDFQLLQAILTYLDDPDFDPQPLKQYETYEESTLKKDIFDLYEQGYTKKERIEVLLTYTQSKEPFILP